MINSTNILSCTCMFLIYVLFTIHFPYIHVHRITMSAHVSLMQGHLSLFILAEMSSPRQPSWMCWRWQEQTADLPRTVMSHIDRTLFSDDDLLEFAKRGCYLEYNLFGIECSHYQVSGMNPLWYICSYRLAVPRASHDMYTVATLYMYMYMCVCVVL